MRNILLFLLMVASVSSLAQSVTNQGSPSTIIVNKGGLQVDSILTIPSRGSNAYYGRNGNIAIDRATGKLKYHNGIQWVFVENSGAFDTSQVVFVADSNDLYVTPTQLHDSIATTRPEAPHFTLQFNKLGALGATPITFSMVDSSLYFFKTSVAPHITAATNRNVQEGMFSATSSVGGWHSISVANPTTTGHFGVIGANGVLFPGSLNSDVVVRNATIGSRIVFYNGNGSTTAMAHITDTVLYAKGSFKQGDVLSQLIKANSQGKLIAADSTADYVTPSDLNTVVVGIEDTLSYFVRYTDTAGMLSGYIRTADSGIVYVTPNGLNITANNILDEVAENYVSYSDTTDMLDGYVQYIDSGTVYVTPHRFRVDLSDSLLSYIPLVQKGAANGVATLGADGKLPNSQLPALAITDVFVVNSQAAMLALSAANQGDVAIRTDIQKSFILASDPYSTLSNWSELLSPTAPTVNLTLGANNGLTQVINNSSGTGVTIPAASGSVAGLLAATDKTKLDGIAAGAEVNVNPDWNATSGDAHILNKPSALPPSGAAGGDLSGTYPNPQVVDNSHGHTIGNVTGLQDSLAAKLNTETDPVYTADDSKIAKYRGGMDGANADTLTQAGWYNNGSGSPTGTNFAVVKSGFLKTTPYLGSVFSAVEQEQITAVPFQGGHNQKYFRTSWNGVYNTWREYAFVDWVQSWVSSLGYISQGGSIQVNPAGSLADASDANSNKTWFDYSWAGTAYPGSVINFTGLGGNYSTELFSNYNNGTYVGIRTRNGDLNTWNPVRKIWTDYDFSSTNISNWHSAYSFTSTYSTPTLQQVRNAGTGVINLAAADASNPNIMIRDNADYYTSLWANSTGGHIQSANSTGYRSLYLNEYGGALYYGGTASGNEVATKGWINAQGFLSSIPTLEQTIAAGGIANSLPSFAGGVYVPGGSGSWTPSGWSKGITINTGIAAVFADQYSIGESGNWLYIGYAPNGSSAISYPAVIKPSAFDINVQPRFTSLGNGTNTRLVGADANGYATTYDQNTILPYSVYTLGSGGLNLSFAPNAVDVSKLGFFLGDYENDNVDNNNYSDNIYFNAWHDATGGDKNMLSIKKFGDIGMRLYRGAFASSSAFSSYRDVAFQDQLTLDHITNNGNTTTNDITVGSITAPGIPAAVGGNYQQVVIDNTTGEYQKVELATTYNGTYTPTLANEGGTVIDVTMTAGSKLRWVLTKDPTSGIVICHVTGIVYVEFDSDGEGEFTISLPSTPAGGNIVMAEDLTGILGGTLSYATQNYIIGDATNDLAHVIISSPGVFAAAPVTIDFTYLSN